MAKTIKENIAFIRRLAIHDWEHRGRNGAFLRVYVDSQSGRIFYDTMNDRFELTAWVIAKIQGIYKLVTKQEAEKAEMAELLATFA